MTEYISKFFAVLLALFLYLTPLLLILSQQDQAIQSYVSQEVVELTESICTKGSLDATMYQQFLNKLYRTNLGYQVAITHEHIIYQPVYDKTGVFQNSVTVQKKKLYTKQILKTVLEKNQPYTFTEGDYVSIQVFNKSKSFKEKIAAALYGKAFDKTILYTYGGKIRNA